MTELEKMTQHRITGLLWISAGLIGLFGVLLTLHLLYPTGSEIPAHIGLSMSAAGFAPTVVGMFYIHSYYTGCAESGIYEDDLTSENRNKAMQTSFCGTMIVLPFFGLLANQMNWSVVMVAIGACALMASVFSVRLAWLEQQQSRTVSSDV